MCPGGTVVCASSAKGEIVTNGMSEYARDKENANAAILVGIEPGDFPTALFYPASIYSTVLKRKLFYSAARITVRLHSLSEIFLTEEHLQN